MKDIDKEELKYIYKQSKIIGRLASYALYGKWLTKYCTSLTNYT